MNCWKPVGYSPSFGAGSASGGLKLKICFTLFITLEQEVFQQKDGRDIAEVKSCKNSQTKHFEKAELFSHFHHSCRHPPCSCLFSSELKLRPTLNLKEWPTLFTKSSLLLCSENAGIGIFFQYCKVGKHCWMTYWVFESYTRMQLSFSHIGTPLFFFLWSENFNRWSVSRACNMTWLRFQCCSLRSSVTEGEQVSTKSRKI